LRVRPALAFLETVSLLGYRTNFTLRSSVGAQVIEPFPTVCFSATPSVLFEGQGFFKTPGISIEAKNTQSAELFNGATVFSDSCKGVTALSIDKPPSAPAWQVGLPATVRVSAARSPGYAPKTGPTGSVTVSMDGQSCSAMLQPGPAPTQAVCSLTPNIAGNRPISVSYGGDQNYVSASTRSTAVIAKAGTNLAISANQDGNSFAPSLKLVASVVPLNGAQGFPTGTVSFYNGPAVVCTATLSAGTGQCFGTIPQSGTTVASITAAYGGDANFSSSSAAAVKVTSGSACTPENRTVLANAVLGQWTVWTSESGIRNMTIEPNGVGYYTTSSGSYPISWKIVGADEPVPSYYSSSSSPLHPLGTSPGCIFIEGGFWHPAYSGYVRTNLTMPVTGFTLHDLGGVAGWAAPNYFGRDLSQVPVVMTYKKQ
jgi:hypothetical protein